MESFQDAAMQMLKEFRALLQHSPVPLPCNRFLQLLALNMFAIDSTQLKGKFAGYFFAVFFSDYQRSRIIARRSLKTAQRAINPPGLSAKQLQRPNSTFNGR